MTFLLKWYCSRSSVYFVQISSNQDDWVSSVAVIFVVVDILIEKWNQDVWQAQQDQSLFRMQAGICHSQTLSRPPLTANQSTIRPSTSTSTIKGVHRLPCSRTLPSRVCARSMSRHTNKNQRIKQVALKLLNGTTLSVRSIRNLSSRRI